MSNGQIFFYFFIPHVVFRNILCATVLNIFISHVSKKTFSFIGMVCAVQAVLISLTVFYFILFFFVLIVYINFNICLRHLFFQIVSFRQPAILLALLVSTSAQLVIFMPELSNNTCTMILLFGINLRLNGNWEITPPLVFR